MELNLREADIAAIFDKGLQAHNAGDLSAAEQLYQETLAIKPEHPEANHNIGVVLVAKNELDRALVFFKFALDNSPNVSLFWASYIDTLIKLERIGESKNLVKAVKQAGISCDKIEVLSQHLDVQHQDPGPKKSEDLNKLLEQQKFKDAIKMCQSLTETYPSSVVLNFTLGKCYFELGQIEPAIESYQKATEINPKCAEAYFYIGMLLKEKGEPKAAIEHYQTVIEIDPNSAAAYNNMGVILRDTGNPDCAIKNLKQALIFDPNCAETYNNIGNSLSDKGDHEAAIENYQQAIKINPDHADAFANLGFSQRDSGNLNAAIKSYEKALELKPNYIVSHFNMGMALRDQGNQDGAIESYKRAIHIDPNCAEAYNNIGNIYKEAGNLDSAIENYLTAIKLDPVSYSAHNNLGISLERRGETDAAIKSFKQASKLDPENASVRHILAALTGQQTPSAPNDFVEGLFDSYAVRFDQSLVEQLKYNVPKLIAQLVLKYQSDAPLGSIMDLGCGTGLAGVELKDFCQEIEGIDLSKKMLAKASQKNVYSELNHTGIIEYLAEAPLDFDLFLSTDVFVYVGELSEVFRLIKSRNKRHGRLAFSTEHTEKADFFLEASGRYSHSKSYIESLCDKFDYQLLNFSTIDLRKSGSEFITGGLYLLEF
jgi:predicted TPR repeat methyltransferase